jgi:hypothetical protein
MLHVTAGYVALEHQGRESLIPAGLMCMTRVGSRPGTPFSESATPPFRRALQRFDFDPDGQGTLGEVLAHAVDGDEITLWHLLSRAAGPEQCLAVFEKLSALHAPPSGVSREGILAGEKSMLEAWGRQLDLPSF